ncbi:MAG: chromosome segregation protein SMC [Legionellales bacterium]|nr:MAG: chromosome segregation protein SMC [Legionellales bacterium]
MRLKSIKLAGFKSFVDVTTLDLRSNLTAIVGPNGCGKSNTIDAVRWVMGESSAKNLRGESMTDVIFNGSATRKPLGQASIELIFDNTDNRLSGEYANYAELALRREVTRDGQSNYYLNGARCRKRDITDIFMGTGLGPKSYAIIEQGMIARVLDSKPQELRLFFEEAAGISLYKKRRHDTMLRMQHTTENLERVQDICTELDKQLNKLNRQAKDAEKFTAYQQEQNLLTQQLLGVRAQTSAAELQRSKAKLKELLEQLEQHNRNKFTVSKTLQQHRDDHAICSAAVNKNQEQFYNVVNTVSMLEQKIQHAASRKQDMQIEAQQVAQEFQEINNKLQQDKTIQAALQEELDQLQPQYITAEQEVAGATEISSKATNAAQVWQSSWDVVQREVMLPSRDAEVGKTKILQNEQEIRNANATVVKLKQELDFFNLDDLQQEVLVLQQQQQQQQNEVDAVKEAILNVVTNIKAQRIQNNTQESIINSMHTALHTLEGKKASLDVLQQESLGKNCNKAITAWLQQNELAKEPRLGELLSVTPGWERAVEIVLGHNIETICIEQDPANFGVDVLQDINITLLDLRDVAPKQDHLTANNLLINKITTRIPITTILPSLNKIYIADDMQAALELRKSLSHDASIITKHGVWLGTNWIKVVYAKDKNAGTLQRTQQLVALQQEILAVKQQLAAAQEQLKENIETLHELEQKRDALYNKQQETVQLLALHSSKHGSAATRLDNMQHRIAQLHDDLKEQDLKIIAVNSNLTKNHVMVRQAALQLSDLADRKEILESTKLAIQASGQKTTQQLELAKNNFHTLSLKTQELSGKHRAAAENIVRLEQQHAALQQRQTIISANLDGCANADAFNADLIKDKKQRDTIAVELEAAKTELTQLGSNIITVESECKVATQQAAKVQRYVDDCRISEQGFIVRQETFMEEADKLGVNLATLIKQLPEGLQTHELSGRLEKITNSIARLGAINLAAIGEFAEESKRRNDLQEQHDDLLQALKTLEDAIKKIDIETKDKFKATYDAVNTNFQELFPKLFGGGKAYLDLIGDDLLDAGVAVMASPPGKRNASIQLLSGGEKALVATALVFAIFQLNPAPFCMLDEVDAPLDDANVGRFCNLVRHMSAKVQFIYISHNKLAMEMAHQLVGVTMREPGVSRLVAVDMEEALAMAV